MEHSFDTLSKEMARAVSRREAIRTLLRGSVGIFLMSAGFSRRSAQAESTACTACGSCATLNVTTSEIATCTESCEAQTLCNSAQSYAPYQLLTSTLEGNFQAVNYDALISINSSSQTQLFHTVYVSPTDSTQTADLFVVWGTGAEVVAFAALYSGGIPTASYIVNDSSVVQLEPLPQSPPPFSIAVSPSSVLVAQKSSVTGTISTTVASEFDAAIGFSASGLPSGATASFKPTTIVAPGSGSSVMRIKADAATPAGVYEITVTGATRKGLLQTANIWLTVTTAAGGTAALEEFQSLHESALSSVEASPPVTTKHEFGDALSDSSTICTAACGGVALASGYAAGLFCADALTAAVVAVCGLARRGAGACIAAAAAAEAPLLYACKNGVGPLIGYFCSRYCKCSKCESVSITGTCSPRCSASNCAAPSTCDPEGCGCIETTCSAGSYPCGPNGCCENGAPCVSAPCGTWGCGPVGWVACAPEGACQPGTSCCGLEMADCGAILECCSPGESCFVYPEGPAAGCFTAGQTPCGLPGWGAIWTCPPGEACGSTFDSCVSG